MTPAQQTALEAVAGHALTAEELAECDQHLDPDARNDVALTEIVSRRRPVVYAPVQIGIGTVLATLGPGAGAWLDAITAVGAVNRDVYWALKLLDRGVLEMHNPATRTQMAALAAAVPDLAAGLNALLALSKATPNPVDISALSRALNVAEGRMTF